jgi:DNA polymerase kappa
MAELVRDRDKQENEEAAKSGEASDSVTSLKYRLLGPSLTKAGQDTVDQQKVSEIIYNASKGSKFFANERARDKALTVKIERLITQRDKLQKNIKLVEHETQKADILLQELESTRDLTQIIVHVDCDAFYAAVEQLDRPELKDIPFGVGKGVITTCNYEARKWGVRSGMAGFVAAKLCPNLTFIPLNFAKYTAVAKKIRAVLETYDPNFEPASIDEAYLNITEYCSSHSMSAEDVVSQMRAEVEEKVLVTVSAGIAPNAKLAKLGSNVNKPNGQCSIPADSVQSILDFIHPIPVRKINGIGRVLERELVDVLEVNMVRDLYAHRGLLTPLFGDKAAEFLLRTYLGLGRTNIAPADESDRKSVGTERTFRELHGRGDLRQKLSDIAAELEKDMLRAEVKGQTVVLKVKLHTYEVLTRQTPVIGAPVHTAKEFERYAAPMLARLEKEHESTGFRLRLMGLRCTHLVPAQKMEIPADFFGPASKQTSSNVKTDKDGWEVWPEEEFEAAERMEREAEANEIEKWSQEYAEDIARDVSDKNPAANLVNCPICSRPQPSDDKTLNAHIDSCLSKQTIGEIVKENKENDSTRITPVDKLRKKRGRSHMSSNENDNDHDSQRTNRLRHDFFSKSK